MSATVENPVEKVAFQAETKELLDLVIHSLYTNKEIFLRELISNASDALDKVRYEALTNDDLAISVDDLKIRLEVDREARLLRIIDNGIGMSRDEVVSNIGTIARSGTKAFLQKLEQAKDKPQGLPELIGQFGVGFYSAFIVADEVVLETRRTGEEKGVRWRSKADGEYTLEEIEKDWHGTTVILHLKPLDTGAESARDFTAEWVLKEVVKHYSDFIEYPIEMETGEGEKATVEVLNSRKPLWTRARHEIEDSEYHEFYKHVSHDWNPPLETIHFKAEGASEYTVLLFLPKQRPMDLFDPARSKSRVHLYVRRVFITDDCEELVPVWLRFLPGVVDAADLPLNVSRETLQHDRRLGQMRKRITRKVLDTLEVMQRDRREDYETFWAAFGAVLKEGLYYDDENRQEIAKLALFPSSTKEGLRTLPEYVADMPVSQKEIFVLVAPDLDSARRSPHLEALNAQGREVLFLVDPVDEFVLQRLTEFDEKVIRRVDQGEVDLEDEAEKSERAAKEKELEPVLTRVKESLGDQVEAVRFSKRLTESPACLVDSENDLSPQLRRMMQEQGQVVPPARRVLELNADHPVVARLSGSDAGEEFGRSCELLLGLAHVAEGGVPSDPARFTKLVSELLLKG